MVKMGQIENEFGSYGDDKSYLHHLVRIARRHLRDDVILYNTDGGSRENLNKGTIPGDAVFSGRKYGAYELRAIHFRQEGYTLSCLFRRRTAAEVENVTDSFSQPE